MQSLRIQQFIEEYLKDGNGTQAAIRAGYSKRTATVQASRLLANAKVQKIVRERRQELAEREGVTREWLVAEARGVIEKCRAKGAKFNPRAIIQACYFLAEVNGFMVKKSESAIDARVHVQHADLSKLTDEQLAQVESIIESAIAGSD